MIYLGWRGLSGGDSGGVLAKLDPSRVETIDKFGVLDARENAMLYWREGNHASIALNPEKLKKSMNKRDQHQFVIPLNSWISRFVSYIFFTPYHLFDCGQQVFDASR